MPCFIVQGKQKGMWKHDPERWGQFGLATEFRSMEEAEVCVRYIGSTWGADPERVRNLHIVEQPTRDEMAAEFERLGITEDDLYCNLP